MNIRVSGGFALPTVLIAGLVAMMVLFTALTASSGVRSALDEQYYQQLAREAAESGSLYARSCLDSNNNISSWEGKTLTPKTNCSGNNVSSYPDSLSLSGNVETTFVVDSLSAEPDARYATVTGYVNLKRQTDGSTWRTYQHSEVAAVASQVSIGSLAFGYFETATRDAGVFVGGVTSSGVLKAQGQNSLGQLGQPGSTSPVNEPTTVTFSTNYRIRQVFASDSGNGTAMFGISQNGNLYATGGNASGQLGIGNVTSPITSLTSVDIGSEKAKSVTNLPEVTFVVTESGKLLSAGSCDDGSLGRMEQSGGWFCFGDSSDMLEVSLPSGSGLATEKIAADEGSVLMITSNGRVYAWGKNNQGQLGIGSTSNARTPARVGTFGNTTATRAIDVATDGNTSYILQNNGQLFVTGSASNNMYANPAGSLVMPVTSPTNITSRITGVSVNSSSCTGTITDVETDNGHTAVLTSTGDVCTFGRNSQGQLGHGDNSTSAGSKRVGLPTTRQAVSIAVGAEAGTAVSAPSNTYAILDNGQVYGTGSNYYGQLGYNSAISSRNVFVPMRVFGPSEPAARVQTGMGTTVIHTENGRVYITGNNQYGQIGDGTFTNRRVPILSEYSAGQPNISF